MKLYLLQYSYPDHIYNTDSDLYEQMPQHSIDIRNEEEYISWVDYAHSKNISQYTTLIKVIELNEQELSYLHPSLQ
jgi:hypothetical protein